MPETPIAQRLSETSATVLANYLTVLEDSTVARFFQPLSVTLRLPLRVLALGAAGGALFSMVTACSQGNAKPVSESATTRGARLATPQAGREGSAGRYAQACAPTPTSVCYRGIARPGNADEDPMQSPLADWIWFGAAGDSIEVSASPSAYVATSLGQERDAQNNTALRFRHRLKNDGVVLVWLSFDEQVIATLPYVLRIWHNGSASASLRPTARKATLTVASRRKNDRFSLVPASIASTVRDRSRWTIYAQTYNVALVSDSLYELCRLPCSAPVLIKLSPSIAVIQRF